MFQADKNYEFFLDIDIILTHLSFIIKKMKLKFRAAAVIFSIFLVFLSCTTKQKVWLDDGTFIYHMENRENFVSSEKLAVFAGSDGCFHIFDNFSKTEIKTFSSSKFVRELSFVAGKYHYRRIAVLDFPGADNEKIQELLNDANLFGSVEYDFSANARFAKARTLEFPQTELNFYYAG